jgi:RsiW-degrading membrane proteinase PrsW (M82 family)
MSELNKPAKIVINLDDLVRSEPATRTPAAGSKIVINPGDVEPVPPPPASGLSSPWASPLGQATPAPQTAASNRIVISPEAITSGPTTTARPPRPHALSTRHAPAFDIPRVVPLAVCTLGLGWGLFLLLGFLMPNRGFSPFLDQSAIPIFLLAASALILATICGMYFVRPANARSMPVAHFIPALLFTMTAGLFLLLLLQQVAASELARPLRAHGRATWYYLIVRFIGECYQWTKSPNAVQRFIGFIFGVGLCEEFTKLLPLFYLGLKSDGKKANTSPTYRGFLLTGFFSGLGFGIGEALYCYAPWLGHTSVAECVARWFAVVPSHAIWTMVAAAVLWYLLPVIKARSSSYAKLALCALATAIAAVVHGVYDGLCSLPLLGPAMVGIALAVLVWIVRAAGEARGEGDVVPGDDKFASAPAGKLLVKLESEKWIFPALYAAGVVFILMALAFSTTAGAQGGSGPSRTSPTVNQNEQVMTEQQFMELLEQEAARQQQQQQREGNRWMENLGTCSLCGGEGYYRYVDSNGVLQRRECPRCGGTGRGW